MGKDIIVRLHGGLGNIMFQYAIGRHLSLKNGSPIKYDVTLCKVNPLGDYSLSLEAFMIDIERHLATPEEIAYFKKYKRKPGRRWFLYNKFIADGSLYVTEKQFNFDPSVLKKKPPVYLEGWWQTENYFKDCRAVLLDDFTVRAPIEGRNATTADLIRSSNAVGVHIRRLDYVSNPQTRAYHGELSRRYYEEAIARVRRDVESPTFFIFSDDIHSVKRAFRMPEGTHYIDWNNALPHEDVRLMSLCKHNIIANSTLGWWGAWLNRNENKIVVAPSEWFAGGRVKNDDRDIVPEDWIKIPSYFQD